MKPVRWLWAIGLLVGTLGWSLAQTPPLVLTNGDVNGDNTIDDTDLLAVLFAMGQSCPLGCPEGLTGDGVVDDADLLIVMFHSGQQGSPAFAGQVQSPSGAFGTTLTVRLGDWVGSVQSVKVQLKPVGTESDGNVPIYEYTAAVGGTDTAVELTHLPAGVYTVRALPVAAGRWLRAAGRILTEVPWVFAAPTGANKVTVYWDPVLGATGYRVRWSTASGVYPNVSSVQPADARKLSITGLTTEQEYFFVVEAEYNGVWSAPSEEDSAVPHAGAIPWDTEDPNQIIPAVRAALGIWDGDISVLSPEGWYYSETGWSRWREKSPVYLPIASEIVTADGGLIAPMSQQGSGEQGCTATGPYRRVKTREGLNAVGARGEFYLPPRQYARVPGNCGRKLFLIRLRTALLQALSR